MLRNEKKPPCKCGSVSKLKKPIPRFPKNEEINTNKELEKMKVFDFTTSDENKKKKINRYRWILTRMRDDSQIKTKPQIISGFLPFTPMYQR
jgi:hypothetical protein